MEYREEELKTGAQEQTTALFCPNQQNQNTWRLIIYSKAQ